ncbi:MAG: hypothetical protein OEU54_06490 [Gemmatimonadota bacterium]|nr:hypothetical protein [Gemmatimonadota bacterium]
MPPPSPPAGKDLSQRGIFRFWVPLAATWVMMAAEGPFLAAVIARLADPTISLAAYGVAIAYAVLVESPVIMLMSAATALIEDEASYRRLRNFANLLNAFATSLLLITLIPPVHRALFFGVLGLPEEVAAQTYGALWCFLPWPAAIGVRRFLQGVMIRAGRTRLVAYGTVIRLLAMATSAIVFGPVLGLPGSWVGGAALSTGVVVEAIAARIMARPSIREVLGTAPAGDSTGLSYREIGSFYYPLLLTSLIGLAVGPMVTFFMGRSVAPVESLAVFPVVHSLLFVFRALGLSFQDASIALLGRGREGVPELSRFGRRMGFAITALLVAIAFTPLADVWFMTVSGLSAELTAYAITPLRIVVLLPLAGVWLSFERGVLMRNRRTRPITWATAAEVVVIAAVFIVCGWVLDMVGVTAAAIALLFGKLMSTLYLVPPTRLCLREVGAPSRLDE